MEPAPDFPKLDHPLGLGSPPQLVAHEELAVLQQLLHQNTETLRLSVDVD